MNMNVVISRNQIPFTYSGWIVDGTMKTMAYKPLKTWIVKMQLVKQEIISIVPFPQRIHFIYLYQNKPQIEFPFILPQQNVFSRTVFRPINLAHLVENHLHMVRR